MEGSAQPSQNGAGGATDQHRLRAPTVLASGLARSLRRAANSNAKEISSQPLSASTEPPLPLTPRRLALIKSLAKDPLPSDEGEAAWRIAQRFGPPAPPPHDPRPDALNPLAPLLTLASEIRRLAAVLIFVALLPNVALGLILWLGMSDSHRSQPVTPAPATVHTPKSQAAIPSPVLSAPAMLESVAGAVVALPLALDGTDGVPEGSEIVIRGLPQGSKLSNGHPRGLTEWSLRPDEIGDLHLMLPADASGDSALTIQLVAADAGVVAGATTILKMTAEPNATLATAAIEAAPATEPVSDERAEALEAAPVEERQANVDEAASDPVPPLPTRRPAPGADDVAEASWIKSPSYLNLRQGPSSTSAVLTVVAKGTKLLVMGRKRGWVQVTNPATSHSGWIYAGNAATLR